MNTIYFHINRTTGEAYSAGRLPETFGNITGFSQVDYATCSDLSWVDGMAGQGFVLEEEARAIPGMDQARIDDLKLTAMEIVTKEDRTEAVERIIVEVEGMMFDGDEESQSRMSRAIVSLNPGEVTLWKLADNTAANVTREQLQAALRAAGAAQTALWFVQA
jgi:hypothetical protein